MALLLAVVEKRLGLHLSGYDVYLNVVGGLRLDEPAIDVGIVAAIVSSFRDHPLDSQTCCIGEVGLGGEIRPVSQVDLRIHEAMKLGFQRPCVSTGTVPKDGKAWRVRWRNQLLDSFPCFHRANLTKHLSNPGIELYGVREVGEVFDHVVTSAS